MTQQPTGRVFAGVIIALALTLGVTACSRADSPALWSPAEPPVLETATDTVSGPDDAVADGRYWGTIVTDTFTFDLDVARFGATCEEWAAARGMQEGCPNDYAVEDVDGPQVALADDARVSVAAPSGPGTSWWIDGATLTRIAGGDTVGVPAGYSWTPFPFVVTVENGSVTTAEQLWVP